MLRYFLETLGDVRRAVRVSVREATISSAVLLTVALGLGATVAVLSVVRAALLEPLPYEDAGRLVLIGERPIGSPEQGSTSFPAFLEWRARTSSFLGLEAYEGTNVTARVGDDAEMIQSWRVTPGFFALLGVQPSAGRTWVAGD